MGGISEFSRRVMEDYFRTVVFPGMTDILATAGQTVFTVAGTWDTINDRAIAWVNGNRRYSGTTLTGASQVTISPAAAAGDVVTILVTPGAGSGYVTRLAGSLLGNLNAGGNRVTNLAVSSASTDAVRRDELLFFAGLLDPDNFIRRDGTLAMLADFDFGGFKGINLDDGTDPTDAVNVQQMNAAISAGVVTATPVGTILPFGGSGTPTGWFACDGSAVSRTTYADLFAAIGTLWGVGDGSTTFNLPNLQDYFLRGWTGSYAPGVTEAELVGPHEHQVHEWDVGHTTDYGQVRGGSSFAGGTPYWVNGAAPGANAMWANNPSGSETRPKNKRVKLIIKY